MFYRLARMREHYDSVAVAGMVEGLAAMIAQPLRPDRAVVVIGIRTRGDTLADRLFDRLSQHHQFTAIERGVLDITLYRDDLSEIGPKPMVRPTRIDSDIAGKPLVLVDDVLFTGRTVRAALDALADFGRPSAIRLAVLVDRGGRELPIQPDCVALTLDHLPADRVVKVRLIERDGRDSVDVEMR